MHVSGSTFIFFFVFHYQQSRCRISELANGIKHRRSCWNHFAGNCEELTEIKSTLGNLGNSRCQATNPAETFPGFGIVSQIDGTL